MVGGTTQQESLNEPLLACEVDTEEAGFQDDRRIGKDQSLDPVEATSCGIHPHDVDNSDGTNDNEDNDSGEDSTIVSKLIFFKALYFLNGLSASTWGRFGVIYYNNICHLSPRQIGILQGIAPLLSFVSMPIWGMLSDACHSRKGVYMVTKTLNTMCLIVMATTASHNFASVLACVSGMAIFRSSGVLDAFVLDALGDRHKTKYGSIRLWTAISWGLGAVGMGCLTDRFGFEWNFVLYVSMMTSMLLVVGLGLPARSKSEQARYELWQEQQRQRQQELPTQENTLFWRSGQGCPRPKILFQALARIPVFIWLLQVIVIGTGMALVDSFLFVFLQNDLNATTQLCGLTVGITVLFELPIFHYSEYLLAQVGHDVLFVISMVAYIIRAFGYTYLTPSSVHWVLVLEILHGITFACMWIASIDFSASVAPKEWATTVQTILSASFGCLSSTMGSIVGGWVTERYSAVFMYRGMGWIVLAVLVLHLFSWICCNRGHDEFLKSLQEHGEIRETDDALSEHLMVATDFLEDDAQANDESSDKSIQHENSP